MIDTTKLLNALDYEAHESTSDALAAHKRRDWSDKHKALGKAEAATWFAARVRAGDFEDDRLAFGGRD